MPYCFQCYTRLWFFREKYSIWKNDYKVFYCKHCNTKRIDKAIKKATSYINKYMDNNPELVSIATYVNKNNSLKKAINSDGIDASIHILNRKKNSAKKIEDVEHINLILHYLGDIIKLIEVLEIKNVHMTPLELINQAGSVARVQLEEKIDKKLGPLYEAVVDTVGYFSVDDIIKAVMGMPKYKELSLIEYSVLLKKFDINIDEESINMVIDRIREQKELRRFSRALKTTKKWELTDYQHLDGYQFEDFLEKLFEANGYTAITTPKGSDQGADLLLLRDGVKYVVQAKKHKKPVGNKAVQEVVAAMKMYDAKKAIVVSPSGYTKSAHELAAKNSVALLDKVDLEEFIEKANQ